MLGVARTSAYLSLLAQLVVLGLGIGLIGASMTSVQLGSVERSRAGIASGSGWLESHEGTSRTAPTTAERNRHD